MNILSDHSTSEVDSMAMIDYIIYGIDHGFPVFHWVNQRFRNCR